jgi:hypothetical protein
MVLTGHTHLILRFEGCLRHYFSFRSNKESLVGWHSEVQWFLYHVTQYSTESAVPISNYVVTLGPLTSVSSTWCPSAGPRTQAFHLC